MTSELLPLTSVRLREMVRVLECYRVVTQDAQDRMDGEIEMIVRDLSREAMRLEQQGSQQCSGSSSDSPQPSYLD